jgi:hypothetical protein
VVLSSLLQFLLWSGGGWIERGMANSLNTAIGAAPRGALRRSVCRPTLSVVLACMISDTSLSTLPRPVIMLSCSYRCPGRETDRAPQSGPVLHCSCTRPGGLCEAAGGAISGRDGWPPLCNYPCPRNVHKSHSASEPIAGSAEGACTVAAYLAALNMGREGGVFQLRQCNAMHLFDKKSGAQGSASVTAWSRRRGCSGGGARAATT